jgi:hypothetical protein
VKTKKNTLSEPSTSPDPKKTRLQFNKPFKKVLVDLAVFFIINTVYLYGFLFVVPDQTIAMLCTVLVGIIAWRGGFAAGLLGCLVIFTSMMIGMYFPPHNSMPTQLYINNVSAHPWCVSTR